MSEQYKKFGELPRAEQLELIEHVLDGGKVEILPYPLEVKCWNLVRGTSDTILFHKGRSYRKFKSELDLLKQQRDELDKKIEELEGIGVGDFVKKKGSTPDETIYKVSNNEMSKDFPYMVGGHFYKKNQLNHQFMKVKQQQLRRTF